MQPDRLTALLRAGLHSGERAASAGCPDVHLIAGYVDGGLEPVARQQVESHLADCTGCLELVALLCREREPGQDTRPTARKVDAPAVATRRLPSRLMWQRAPAWAAAAMLAVIVPTLLVIAPYFDVTTGHTGGRYTPTRAAAQSEVELHVLSPLPGATIGRGELEIRWTEVPGSPHYDVRIVTESGDLVARDRVESTSWRPPFDADLRSGVAYYVHVEAYPGGDKALGSEHVPFRVADGRP